MWRIINFFKNIHRHNWVYANLNLYGEKNLKRSIINSTVPFDYTFDNTLRKCIICGKKQKFITSKWHSTEINFNEGETVKVRIMGKDKKAEIRRKRLKQIDDLQNDKEI